MFSLTEHKIVANSFNSVDNLKTLFQLKIHGCAINHAVFLSLDHKNTSRYIYIAKIHYFSNLTLSSSLVIWSKKEGYSGRFIFGKSILTHFFKCSLTFLLTILLTLHTHPFRQVKMKLFGLPFHLNPQVFVEIKYQTPMVSLQLKIGIPYSLLTKLYFLLIP